MCQRWIIRGLALCGAVSQAARSDLLMMRIHSTNTYLSTYRNAHLGEAERGVHRAAAWLQLVE
jgi:hypothetical protein